MGRHCVPLMALLLSPAMAMGGLAKVEEVPLTSEEVARVSNLTEATGSQALSEAAETAILVKGDQGRPCILKPGPERGWKKLCAVFWLPGSEIHQVLKNTPCSPEMFATKKFLRANVC